MNWNAYLYPSAEEKPLDHLVQGYSHTSIFRAVAFIGDSLSSGEFETVNKEGKKGYHDMFEYSWGQYIARQNGFKAYNFSRGGMTAREYINGFAEAQGFWDPAKACQAYVIALGVNDLYNKGYPLGTMADIDPEDYHKNKPTFIGEYAHIISRYREISPDAKFFLVTFPNTESHGQRPITKEMVDALYALAAHFENTYVIDLFQYGPYYDEAFKEAFCLHSHLNPMGYILTAKLVDSYMDYIIRHNPDDFRQVGFINSGIPYQF